jgi:amidase
VRDCATLLDVTQGPGVGEKYLIPRPERPYLEEVATPPGKLRIAFTTATWSGDPVDAACVTAAEETAALCLELGHRVTEASPSFSYPPFELATLRLWAASLSSTIIDLSDEVGRPPSEAELEATTWATHQYGKEMSAHDLTNALGVMNQVTRSVARFFLEHDVLLTPTTTTPPAPLGTYDANDPHLDAKGWMRQLLSFAAFTSPFNMTGQPAISLPLSEWRGLPIGVQLVGRFGDERTLFRLAGQLEQANPWADRRPPISI